MMRVAAIQLEARLVRKYFALRRSHKRSILELLIVATNAAMTI
jgi:hypothetical protein